MAPLSPSQTWHLPAWRHGSCGEGSPSSPSIEFLLFMFESPRLTGSLRGARLGDMGPLGPVGTLSNRPPAQSVGWGR